MNVQYATFANSWFGFEPFVQALIDEYRTTSVCEVGGGANPALPLDVVHRHDVEYTVLDISATELAKAPAGYRTLELDVLTPHLPIRNRFDFIFSRMVAEHMSDGERFHRNIWQLLRPGGIALHYFPTLCALPFLVNKILAGSVTEWLLHRLQGSRERDGSHGKFPAYYDWCRGPVRRQIERFESIGYAIDQYIGFFGHSYYARIRPLDRVHRALTRWLVEHPAPAITSYAYVVLRKPLDALQPAAGDVPDQAAHDTPAPEAHA